MYAASDDDSLLFLFIVSAWYGGFAGLRLSLYGSVVSRVVDYNYYYEELFTLHCTTGR